MTVQKAIVIGAGLVHENLQSFPLIGGALHHCKLLHSRSFS
ncbi:hypothetical protein AB4Z22_27855 [Paenibacillus sp. TAF58]